MSDQQTYEWGTPIKWHAADGSVRVGQVYGITGLVGHIRVAYRVDQWSVKYDTIRPADIIEVGEQA